MQLGKGQGYWVDIIQGGGQGVLDRDDYGMVEAGGSDALWEEELDDGSKQPVLALQTHLVSPPSPAGSLMFTLLNILLTSCSVTGSIASSQLAGLSNWALCVSTQTQKLLHSAALLQAWT